MNFNKLNTIKIHTKIKKMKMRGLKMYKKVFKKCIISEYLDNIGTLYLNSTYNILSSWGVGVGYSTCACCAVHNALETWWWSTQYLQPVYTPCRSELANMRLIQYGHTIGPDGVGSAQPRGKSHVNPQPGGGRRESPLPVPIPDILSPAHPSG